MKQLYFFLLLLTTVPAMSQRNVDLELTMVYPQPGEYLAPMQAHTLQVSVKNVGTEDFTVSDSLYYYLVMDGSTVIFYPQNEDHLAFTGNHLAPGDSLILSRAMFFDESFNGNETEICVEVLPVNAADPIADPNLDNNTDCATVMVTDAADIDEKAQTLFTVVPNPVRDVLTIVSDNDIRQLRLADASGKLVTVQDHTLQLDCSGLRAGIYILTAVSENGISMQRIVIE